MTRNAESLRRLRAAARAAGLCAECRCRPAKVGCTTCQHCLDKHKERDAAYLAAGLCACGRQRVSATMCAGCLAASNAVRARAQKANVLAGKCSCGRARADSRKRCAPCCESIKRTQAKRREAQLAAGLCTCGACPRPASANSPLCDVHLVKQRGYYERHKAKRKARATKRKARAAEAVR